MRKNKRNGVFLWIVVINLFLLLVHAFFLKTIDWGFWAFEAVMAWLVVLINSINGG